MSVFGSRIKWGDENPVEYLNQLIKLWSSAAGVLLVFVFVQTLLGNFGHYVWEQWIWVFVNTLPVVLILVVLYLRTDSKRRLSEKCLELLPYLRRLSRLIMILLLTTILAEPLANLLLKITIVDLYRKSYFVLLPLDVLLVIMLIVVFRLPARPN